MDKYIRIAIPLLRDGFLFLGALSEVEAQIILIKKAPLQGHINQHIVLVSKRINEIPALTLLYQKTTFYLLLGGGYNIVQPVS